MGKLCEKVIQKIREENITPKPKWQFLMKDCVVWTAFLASIIIGGFAMGAVLHEYASNDWDIYSRLEKSPLEYFVMTLPYYWLLLIMVFLMLAYLNYRNTKEGYHYHAFVIIILSMFGSILLRMLFRSVGLGREIDRIAEKTIPYYDEVHCCDHNKKIWSQPEKGLLAGEVIEIRPPDCLMLMDHDGSIWEVEEAGAFVSSFEMVPSSGLRIKLIGDLVEDHRFRAMQIRPWDR